MKKRLFNEDDERWNNDAITLVGTLDGAIRAVLEPYFEQGYSIRDIQLVAESAVQDIILCELMNAQAEQAGGC